MIAEDDASVRFVLEYARMLHCFGAPAHRLEAATSEVARHLGLQLHIVSAPTNLICGIGEPPQQRTYVLRVDPGNHDLGKLEDLNGLAIEMSRQKLSVEEGLKRLRAIEERPAEWGPIVSVLAFSLVSAAGATLLGGNLEDLALAAVSGLALGGLSLLAPRRASGGQVFELLAATLVSALAFVAAHCFPSIHYHIAMLAGLIVLVPGLTLTISMYEIASRNLVSGTARLTSAAVVFLEILVGIALSHVVLSRFLLLKPPVPGTALPEWLDIVCLPIAAIAAAVLFRAPRRRLPAIVVAAGSAFLATRFGVDELGAALGAGLGGLCAGLLANLYARMFRGTAMVLLVPSLVLLVPGSLGFRSLSSMWERDVLGGVETAFQMVVVAMALVAGILVSNALVAPRRAL